MIHPKLNTARFFLGLIWLIIFAVSVGAVMTTGRPVVHPLVTVGALILGMRDMVVVRNAMDGDDRVAESTFPLLLGLGLLISGFLNWPIAFEFIG